MIIGISGKLGSGKDLTGNIIQYLITEKNNPEYTKITSLNSFISLPDMNKHISSGFQINKFADALKHITCVLLGCTREQLEDREFKEKELGEEWDRYYCLEHLNHHYTISGQAIAQPIIRDLKFHLERKEDFESKVAKLKGATEHSKLEWMINKAGKGDIIDNTTYELVLEKLTPRKLMQLLGTECGRHIIHPNIWVNALMSRYKPMVEMRMDIIDLSKDNGEEGSVIRGTPSMVESSLLGSYPKWIITDLRFPNELQSIKDRGGITIRVNRTPFKWIDYAAWQIEKGEEIEVKEHPSETALDNAEFDYTIDNNGTIEELVKKVKEILSKEKLL